MHKHQQLYLCALIEKLQKYTLTFQLSLLKVEVDEFDTYGPIQGTTLD